MPRRIGGSGHAARASARSRAAAVAAFAASASFAPALPPDITQWPMPGGDSLRTGLADAPGPVSLTPAWQCSTDQLGRTITFVGPSAAVCSHDLVFALGWVMSGPQKQHALYAIERAGGQVRWSASVTAPTVDSWSAPVIDAANRSVITTTGKSVAAFDMHTGAVRWSATLGRSIVNASAVATADLGVSNRLFITQYDGFGDQGSLTCINLDPRLGIANPFDPGEVVWAAPIGGSSGNSPAYCDGVVYCASIGELFVAGRVQAFDARAVSPPAPIWTCVIPDRGFFGGVALHAAGSGLHLYAATYDFEGGVDASLLVKINALDGSLVWTTPCNRTASTPVVLGDGRIILSGGVWGYGTVPSVEVFIDQGATSYRAWHSALDTWADDGDGMLEAGEFLPLGGWSHLPVAIAGGQRLIVGSPPPTGSIASAYSDLYIVDLALLPPFGSPVGPNDRSFLIDHTQASGSSPAVADANAYSVGSDGLVGYGANPASCDVSGDGVVDIDDLYWWDQSRGSRDVDGDGHADLTDRQLLELSVRRDENSGRRR